MADTIRPRPVSEEIVATRPIEERPPDTRPDPPAAASGKPRVMRDPPEDEALVRRASSGDRGAFDALYRLHVERVYAVCLRMVADEAHAEQLTQDAFVLAWRRIGTFRGESAFASWLHRLAVNVVLENSRKERRRAARVEFHPDLERLGNAAVRLDTERRLALERAIASLPPGARTVVVLHDVEGYTHAEIAGMMGTAIGTTKAQLHRARRLLRERLNR